MQTEVSLEESDAERPDVDLLVVLFAPLEQ